MSSKAGVTIVVDPSVPANEIRVNNITSLFNAFREGHVTNGAVPTPPIKKFHHKHKITRLRDDEIIEARGWIQKNAKNLSERDKKVLMAFFPNDHDGMVGSGELDTDALGMSAERARKIRNKLLRSAGVMAR